MRGGAAAEQRALAAGQDGRQVAGVDARRAVAHAVDPAMHWQERAAPEPMLELGERDPAPRSCARVTTPCWRAAKRAEFSLRCPAFTRHCRV